MRVHESPTFRNLGVQFDKFMLGDSHVSAPTKKCNGILTSLTHIRYCIPAHLLPFLVNSLVISYVRYCLAVLWRWLHAKYAQDPKGPA